MLIVLGSRKLKIEKPEKPNRLIGVRLDGSGLWILGCGQGRRDRWIRPGLKIACGLGLAVLWIAVGGLGQCDRA